MFDNIAKRERLTPCRPRLAPGGVYQCELWHSIADDLTRRLGAVSFFFTGLTLLSLLSDMVGCAMIGGPVSQGQD